MYFRIRTKAFRNSERYISKSRKIQQNNVTSMLLNLCLHCALLKKGALIFLQKLPRNKKVFVTIWCIWFLRRWTLYF